MAESGCESGKYFLVGIIGVLLVGNVFCSPLPQQDEFFDDWESENEIDRATHAIIEEVNVPTERTTSGSITEQTIPTTTELTTTTTTTTTEYPYNAIASVYSSPQGKVANMHYASGVHKYTVGHNDDENKRAVEEYKYHFERKEQGLPPTTKRYNMSPPRKY